MVSVLTPSVVDRGFEDRSCRGSVLSTSVVDRRFEHHSCQTTNYKIELCVASLLSTQH